MMMMIFDDDDDDDNDGFLSMNYINLEKGQLKAQI